MGLIKAVLGAAGSVLADQWKEFFVCEAIPKEILVVKGQKRVGNRSSNTKGSDNVITKGSGIVVADGQCMIIVEQGKIVEFCAEPGEFTYDSSTEPSIFSGSLGKGIIESFKTMGRRFTYGGDTGKDQRVYYFNMKEIGDNKFGTATPIPFRVVDQELGFRLSVGVRCNGTFSYRIKDPILFYTNVCGNVSESFNREEIDSTLKGNILDALQAAFANVAAKKISYYEIAAHNMEVKDALNEALKVEWGEKRGLEVFTVNFNSVSVSDEDKKKITEWEETVQTTNPAIAAARLVGGQIDAAKTAAGNTSGAMTGFMGYGMAGAAYGGGMTGNVSNLYGMSQTQQPVQSQQPVQTQQPMQTQQNSNTWQCSCGTQNTGKFCFNCGGAKPVSTDGWMCSCGTQNAGKFCSNCGAKKPAGTPLYRCDKCGWTPEDPYNPPKFCPECGDAFDDKDVL